MLGRNMYLKLSNTNRILSFYAPRKKIASKDANNKTEDPSVQTARSDHRC